MLKLNKTSMDFYGSPGGGSPDGLSLLLTVLIGLAIAALLLSFLRDRQGGAQARRFQEGTPQPHAAAATFQAPSQQRIPSQAASQPSQNSFRCITIAAPGVLLEESSAEELSEGASVIPAAAEALQGCTARSDVFLLCHVSDDIGEAAVRGALEHAGLVGRAAGQIPPQRLLFCDTEEGKVSIVRQLEPDLHVDSHPVTVEQLQRFIPRLAEISQNGGRGKGSSSSNVIMRRSLAEALEWKQ